MAIPGAKRAVLTHAEREARGRAERGRHPRSRVFEWKAGAKRDPLARLREAEAGRVRELLPIKYDRMALSPFSFFRGAAPAMAADLGGRPRTALFAQLCGDAHVRNLGAFAAPDGRIAFDINDFDETTPGPWEWDLKRLATSFVLAGREAGDGDANCREAVRALAGSYRASLHSFALLPVVELARRRISRRSGTGPVFEVLRKAQRSTPTGLLEKLTTGSGTGPNRRFRRRPPLLAPLEPREAARVLRSLAEYRRTLSPGRQLILDAYRPVDAAFKVVGTGSVGSRAYVLLCFGNGGRDPLFLQVKQEFPSCLAPWLPGRADPHHGRRAASGQHRMQTVSDPFLGWTAIGGRHFLVRQLADHKAGVDPGELRGRALAEYARVCGELFARAHARTGDALAIAAYCGGSGKFARLLAEWAVASADQCAADHAAFLRAIRAGRFKRRKA